MEDHGQLHLGLLMLLLLAFQRFFFLAARAGDFPTINRWIIVSHNPSWIRSTVDIIQAHVIASNGLMLVTSAQLRQVRHQLGYGFSEPRHRHREQETQQGVEPGATTGECQVGAVESNGGRPVKPMFLGQHHGG